jgi:hypothetical protein
MFDGGPAYDAPGTLLREERIRATLRRARTTSFYCKHPH